MKLVILKTGKRVLVADQTVAMNIAAQKLGFSIHTHANWKEGDGCRFKDIWDSAGNTVAKLKIPWGGRKGRRAAKSDARWEHLKRQMTGVRQ